MSEELRKGVEELIRYHGAGRDDVYNVTAFAYYVLPCLLAACGRHQGNQYNLGGIIKPIYNVSVFFFSHKVCEVGLAQEDMFHSFMISVNPSRIGKSGPLVKNMRRFTATRPHNNANLLFAFSSKIQELTFSESHCVASSFASLS